MWVVGELWSDPSVVVGGAAFVFVVGTALAICARLATRVPRAYEEQVDNLAGELVKQRDENERLRRANERERRLKNVAIRALQRANVEVPPEVFGD